MAPSWSTKSEKGPLLPLTAQHHPAAGKRTVIIGLTSDLIGEIEDALNVDIDHGPIKMNVPCRVRDPTSRSSGKMVVFSAADITVPQSSVTKNFLLFVCLCVALALAVWTIAAALTLALGFRVDVFANDFVEATLPFGGIMAPCFGVIIAKKTNDEPPTPPSMWTVFCEIGRVLALIGCVLMAIVIAGQFITGMELVPVVSKLAL